MCLFGNGKYITNLQGWLNHCKKPYVLYLHSHASHIYILMLFCNWFISAVKVKRSRHLFCISRHKCFFFILNPADNMIFVFTLLVPVSHWLVTWKQRALLGAMHQYHWGPCFIMRFMIDPWCTSYETHDAILDLVRADVPNMPFTTLHSWSYLQCIYPDTTAIKQWAAVYNTIHYTYSTSALKLQSWSEPELTELVPIKRHENKANKKR